MNSFHFNFKTGKSVNPLELIKRFYINPYMIDSFSLLNLHNLCDSKKNIDIVIINNLPCIVMNINILKLEQAFIKYNNEGSGGTITSNNKVIYFKFTSNSDCIRIDTVLFR
jgi:hypothetical protein